MATYDITQTIPSKIATGDILNCPYSGAKVSLTLPKGIYKLEVWGAQGGSYSTTYYGGKGGYSVGELTLDADTGIHVYVGGQGRSTSSSSAASGGFNGGASGGSGRSGCSYTGYGGQGGGGGTDIRITQDALAYRVIVAGGGGGSSSENGYSCGTMTTGCYGGGTSGETKTGDATWNNPGKPGTQSSAGAGGAKPTHTSSGSDATYCGSGGSGGGGGWYGGGGGSSGTTDGASGNYAYAGSSGSFGSGGTGGSNPHSSSYYSSKSGAGGGGSGYIHEGTNSASSLGQNYILANASTINGGLEFTSPTGTAETGHSGNGYARITVIKSGGGLTIMPKVSNVFQTVTKIYYKQLGLWKPASLYTKVSGEWIN